MPKNVSGPYAARAANAKDKGRVKKLQWTKHAEKFLLGRTIVGVRYLTDEEVEGLGWYSAAVVMVLDDGTLIFPSGDDEGNNAGAMFGQSGTGEEITMPVI